MLHPTSGTGSARRTMSLGCLPARSGCSCCHFPPSGRLNPDFIRTIMVGDVNHSSHTSVGGTALYRFHCDNGFPECARVPTRDRHLLDLVLTDLDEVFEPTMGPLISDHHDVIADADSTVQETPPCIRTCSSVTSAESRFFLD